MKTIAKNFLALLIISSFTSCYMTVSIDGSKNIIEEERTVDAFSSINIDGVCDVELLPGDEGEIVVSANDNIMSRVITEVNDGVLKIDLEDGNYTNVDIEITVYVESIDYVRKDGVGSLDIDDLDPMEILEVWHDGVGNIKMSGEAKEFYYDHNGVGQLNAFAFETEYIHIKQDGVGSAEITASDLIEGSLNGVGSIYYKGNAEVDIDDDGVGNIVDRN